MTPSLAAAMDELQRVGALVGGATARRWARELRDIAARLEEGARHGPGGATWPLEAARLKLAADVAEHRHRRRAALDSANALARRLSGLAGKAVNDDDAAAIESLCQDLREVMEAEAEQVRLAGGRRGALDGKSFFFPREQDADAERLIRRIGGYRERDAEPGPGGYDALHFGRALALISGDREPESDDEKRAIARWREKWG
jgi:hypothetical protein